MNGSPNLTRFSALLPWIAVALWVLSILMILVYAAGSSFGGALEGFFNGAFGGRRFAYLLSTLSRATLIVGMALSVLLSFRAGLFNIGGEGQLVLGGLAAAVVGVYLPGPPLLVLAAGLAAGMAAGMAWAALAGVLQLYAGVPLLVGSLLLNYPARYLASYVVNHPLRDVDSGLPQTFQVNPETWLPLFPGTRLDIGILLIIGVTIAVILYDRFTVHGYHSKMTGLSPAFAEASGVPVRRLTLQTLCMSGAIAGLVGGIAVFGIQHRFTDGMLVEPLYAWTAIISVLLVMMVPWAVPLAGFFFAAISTGAAGMERTAEVPKEIAVIMQAVIILFVASRMTGLQALGQSSGGGHDDV